MKHVFLSILAFSNSGIARDFTSESTVITRISLPVVIAGKTAKDYCSCFFVTGQDPDFCSRYAQLGLPALGFTISFNVEGQDVTASFDLLGRSVVRRQARFVGLEDGCQLVFK